MSRSRLGPLLAIGLSAAPACEPDVLLVVQPDDASVHVDPPELSLERPRTGCSETTLTVGGEGSLEGLVWLPDEGEPDAVVLPDVDAATLGDALSLGVRYCPPDDTPSAGWILLSFDQDRARAIYAQEAP